MKTLLLALPAALVIVGFFAFAAALGRWCSPPSDAADLELAAPPPTLAIDFELPVDPSDPDCLPRQLVIDRRLPDGSYAGIDDAWRVWGAELVYPTGAPGLRVGFFYPVPPSHPRYASVGPFVACG